MCFFRALTKKSLCPEATLNSILITFSNVPMYDFPIPVGNPVKVKGYKKWLMVVKGLGNYRFIK
jgi:hypothetical protein